MRRFFIVGNGFDLHHGLNTDFNNFRSYLKINKRNQYEFINKLISEYNPKFESSDWGQIENELTCIAELDYDQMLEEAINSSETDMDRASYWNDIQYNAEYFNQDLPNFKKSFDGWVENINVRSALRDERVHFSKQDLFLNFNYTNTLQILYEVRDSQILNIHGKLGTEKVFGHNEDFGLPFRMSNLTQEAYDYGFEDDWRIEEAKTILNKIPAQFFKNSVSLIQNNEFFFEQISECDNIIFMGWSLGDQDIIYMEKILSEMKKDSKIYIVHYDKPSETKNKFGAFFKIWNIPEKCITYYTWKRVQELFAMVHE